MVEIKKLQSACQQVALKHGLGLMLLFGSQVSGKTHPHSDIDIAIKAKQRLTLADLAKIQLELSQLSGLSSIDLVSLQDAAPLLIKQMAQESVLLYEGEQNAYSMFKIYAFKTYVENKKFIDLKFKALDKFLKVA